MRCETYESCVEIVTAFNPVMKLQSSHMPEEANNRNFELDNDSNETIQIRIN